MLVYKFLHNQHFRYYTYLLILLAIIMFVNCFSASAQYYRIVKPCGNEPTAQNNQRARMEITRDGDIYLEPCPNKKLYFQGLLGANPFTNVVTSFNGRRQDVTFRASDVPPLDASIINSGLLAVNRVPPLDAAKITSGVFPVERLQSLTSSLATNALAAWNGNYFVSVAGLDSDNAILSGSSSGLPIGRSLTGSGFATVTRPSGNFNFDVTIPDASTTVRGVLATTDYQRFNNYGTQITNLTSGVNSNTIPIFDGTTFVSSPLSTLNSSLTSSLPITLAASGVTANSIVFADANRKLISTPLATDQIFLGQASGAPLAATLAAGTNVTFTRANGTLTINSTATGGAGTAFTGVSPNRIVQYNGVTAVNSPFLYSTGANGESVLGTFGNTGFGSTSYTTGATQLLYTPDQATNSAINLTATTAALQAVSSAGTTNGFVANGTNSTITGGATNPSTITAAANTITLTAQNVKLPNTATPANAVLRTNGVNNITGVSLTNGQLLVGSTGAAPAAATLTAGENVTITNGAGVITIAAAAAVAGASASKATPTSGAATAAALSEAQLVNYIITTDDYRTGKSDTLRFENNIDLTGAGNKSFRVVLAGVELFASGNIVSTGGCRVRTKIVKIQTASPTVGGFVDVICSDTAYPARVARFKALPVPSAGDNFSILGTSATAGGIAGSELTVEQLRAP